MAQPVITVQQAAHTTWAITMIVLWKPIKFQLYTTLANRRTVGKFSPLKDNQSKHQDGINQINSNPIIYSKPIVGAWRRKTKQSHARDFLFAAAVPSHCRLRGKTNTSIRSFFTAKTKIKTVLKTTPSYLRTNYHCRRDQVEL